MKSHEKVFYLHSRLFAYETSPINAYILREEPNVPLTEKRKKNIFNDQFCVLMYYYYNMNYYYYRAYT